MSRKITCSHAQIAWLQTPSTFVDVFSEERVQYERKESDEDGAGKLVKETVTIQIDSDKLPSMLSAYNWFIVKVETYDGWLTVGTTTYPCKVELSGDGVVTTASFTAKSA